MGALAAQPGDRARAIMDDIVSRQYLARSLRDLRVGEALCAYCDRPTLARDEDGDPACARGDGCSLAPSRPVAPGRPGGLR